MRMVRFNSNCLGKQKYLEILVWNPTIANLTLMALGSSAPEILLSCIETVSMLEETPGELGPSTIVGSAAFNLLVISGVSIYSVGDEPKHIDDLGVFTVTCVSSFFAYIWLYLVLSVMTPDYVTLTEAILTFSYFLVLIFLAYFADLYNGKKKKAMENIEERRVREKKE
jgi:solute carrier family 8 (sodium/calcium exchanger)